MMNNQKVTMVLDNELMNEIESRIVESVSCFSANQEGIEINMDGVAIYDKDTNLNSISAVAYGTRINGSIA
ncbi:hypothetical protein [Providencia manganoxydans]|uniref:hypothetical protein n=1 Tax=Providencia manganoxydans TaxID=2923283 RepID=UPI00280C6093|nr:hypothetical protein [Providencia stuartii]ELR5082720.1 hypothetical protein [Providencia stuartii]